MIKDNPPDKSSRASKTSKYLLYAIGEIVLVVIGILIALQLNAWRADIADRKMEQSHLQNFREDLQDQLEIIDAQVAHEKKLILKADSAYSYFTGDISLAKLEDLLYGNRAIGARKTFIKSNASFQDLVSTGGLHLIKDPEMRKEMMSYHQRLDYTTTVINTNNGLIDEMFNTVSSSHVACFSLDELGDLDTTIALTGQERYRIRLSIKMRRSLSHIAITYCELQRTAALDLIAKMDTLLLP